MMHIFFIVVGAVGLALMAWGIAKLIASWEMRRIDRECRERWPVNEALPLPPPVPVFDYRTSARPGGYAEFVTKPECLHRYPNYMDVEPDGSRVLQCVVCDEFMTLAPRKRS